MLRWPANEHDANAPQLSSDCPISACKHVLDLKPKKTAIYFNWKILRTSEMSWFWQRNTWALDKLSRDCNFMALGRGEMAKLWGAKGIQSSPIWNCFQFRIQQPAFQMAGKDYNHLFKLLIIGDSSQYFSLHFRFSQSVYGFVNHRCLLDSFTFLKPRGLLQYIPQCYWFNHFYCFILSWICKFSHLLLWLSGWFLFSHIHFLLSRTHPFLSQMSGRAAFCSALPTTPFLVSSHSFLQQQHTDPSYLPPTHSRVSELSIITFSNTRGAAQEGWRPTRTYGFTSSVQKRI